MLQKSTICTINKLIFVNLKKIVFKSLFFILTYDFSCYIQRIAHMIFSRSFLLNSLASVFFISTCITPQKTNADNNNLYLTGVLGLVAVLGVGVYKGVDAYVQHRKHHDAILAYSRLKHLTKILPAKYAQEFALIVEAESEQLAIKLLQIIKGSLSLEQYYQNLNQDCMQLQQLIQTVQCDSSSEESEELLVYAQEVYRQLVCLHNYFQQHYDYLKVYTLMHGPYAQYTVDSLIYSCQINTSELYPHLSAMEKANNDYELITKAKQSLENTRHMQGRHELYVRILTLLNQIEDARKVLRSSQAYEMDKVQHQAAQDRERMLRAIQEEAQAKMRKAQAKEALSKQKDRSNALEQERIDALREQNRLQAIALQQERMIQPIKNENKWLLIEVQRLKAQVQALANSSDTNSANVRILYEIFAEIEELENELQSNEHASIPSEFRIMIKERLSKISNTIGVTCSICMEPVLEHDENNVRFTTECQGSDGVITSHIFHKNCMKEYKRAKGAQFCCPNCRGTVNNEREL